MCTVLDLLAAVCSIKHIPFPLFDARKDNMSYRFNTVIHNETGEREMNETARNQSVSIIMCIQSIY